MLSVAILFIGCTNKKLDVVEKEPRFFSMQAINQDKDSKLAPLSYLQANDKTSLAYRTYTSSQANAVLIFYHGAGVNSAVGYNHLANKLSLNYPITVITPDLRGHGQSNGTRGDTPSKEQLYDDINSMIEFVKSTYPTQKIFLGAHSASGGLLLNYANYTKNEKVNGYILVAPYLGYKAEIEYTKEKKRVDFSHVDVAPFIYNQMSFGVLNAHTNAEPLANYQK